MKNLLRMTGSFAIVLVAYWVYAVAAVPMIEPSFDPEQRVVVGSGANDAGQETTNRRIVELASLFPPGAWELDNPKILQNDRVKLLIGNYETDQDGNVMIRPCTIVLLATDEKTTPAERIKRAVVLEAPEGALLRFDEPFDLSRAQIGQLVGGRFEGPISIRSAGKSEAPDDDLWVVTRDVQLTEEHIWTPQPVQFRYGPHFGSGREMRICLLSSDDIGSTRKNRRGPRVSGLESFELVHLDRLHLRLPPSKDMPGGSAPPAASPTVSASPNNREDTPVEIMCAGPFRFDAIQRQATFEKNVVVMALRPDGQHDRLENCDRLVVHFMSREEDDPSAGDAAKSEPSKKPSRLASLKPCRLEAIGNPVVFHAPSESADGRGQRLEYDLTNGHIVLDGDQPVFLRKGPNQIEARYLRYEIPEPGHQIGTVVAEGPGRIHALLDDRPDQPFEARWMRELRVRPHQQNQVISLTGGAELLYGGIGHLAAGEIHFFLNEVAATKGSQRLELQPDRMSAETNVKLNSPEMSGQVEQLQIWFEQDETVQGANHLATATPMPDKTVIDPTPSDRTRESASVAAPPRATTSQPLPEQHFHITGRLLQARIILRDTEPDVAELTISDHVEMIETRTAQPDDKPIVVRGECIHVKDASRPYAAVSIKGKPAHFEGQGLTISGTNINVNQGTNRLWIDGAGYMDLPPIGQDLQGRPITSNEPLRVCWQDRMEFDGRTARFEGGVHAATETQRLLTETLEVSLDRMVRFAQAGQLQDMDEKNLQELRCQGKVWMESRSYKGGLQESHEQFETQNLIINNTTGALTAAGPGWIRSIRRGETGPSPWGSPSEPPETTATVDPSKSSDLVYLYVRFQGAMTGNVREHEITFHDQVLTVYGPVESWGATLPTDNPEKLGPRGTRLNCNELTVREMPSPIGEKPSIEFESVGNVRVEGRDFSALAARMSYDQNKDLMILEGDGRTMATLEQQEQVGGAKNTFPAQKIFYRPKTKEVKSVGIGSVEINQFPAKRPGRRQPR
ncbi:MAG: hypothetical protein JW888_13605 [Pirellulales bacterium]|nr:hypothetical protein [Pirellulales bacterium]